MYSLADYLWMLADETRTSAYADAIRAVVRPGDRVLDVGTGFGFFSVIAARAGASHVDAVDVNPAIHLGARLAAANGCADRIAFHHADVERLQLPRQADVLISDLRGPTPFARRSLATVSDARRRLLRPGGAMIPLADTVFAAPCRVPAIVTRDVHAAFGREGLDTAAVERVVQDVPYRCTIEAADLIAPGCSWARIEYASIDSADVRGVARWRFATADVVHGFAVWFTTELAPGIGFSSEPGSPTRVYNQIFLPLRAPVSVEAGEQLRLELALRLVLNEYVWEWRGWLRAASGTDEREVIKQNSIAANVVDPRVLTAAAATIAPQPGQTAAALRLLLARMDGRATPQQLAAALHRDAPELFSTTGAASVFVNEWTTRLADADAGIEGGRAAPDARQSSRESVLHRAAGLLIASDRPLPGFVPVGPGSRDHGEDVRIQLERRPAWADDVTVTLQQSGGDDESGRPIVVVSRSSKGFHFTYADGTLVWIASDGANVWCTWPPAASLDDTCTYLYGPVLALVLRLRGALAFHASAVAIGTGAIGFVGPHGAGKSTLAAALGAAGCPVVTDDVLHVRCEGSHWVAEPFPSILKLWPDGARMALGDTVQLPLIAHGWNKRALALGDRVPAASGPVRMVALACLEEAGPEPSIAPIPPAAALLRLTGNTSAGHLLDRDRRAAEFRLLSSLVQDVACVAVTPPLDPARYPSFVGQVLQWSRLHF